MKEEVTIICSTHGRFSQTPDKHVHGHGCPRCGITRRAKSQSLDNDEFIKRANIVHQGKYDYSRVEYVNENTNVEILCPVHKQFFQTPKNHIIHQQGCRKCGIVRASRVRALDTKTFIRRAKIVHQDKYDYSKTRYITQSIKVEIVCPVHKSFFQLPDNHVRNRQGCPACSSSRTEELVRSILKRIYNLDFPKAHPDFLERLELDCYNEDYKIAIEYNGIQHYKDIPHFHRTDNSFKEQQERDKRKAELCLKHGVDLFVIPYEYDYRDPIRLENYIRTLLRDVLLVL
jgi:predicted RNA-binding Zn-ribbon protein involved in translation (DUF1610 family)